MAIRVNLNPLESTTAFLYLGSTITYNNSDWVALYSNLRKAQKRWFMVSNVLGKLGWPIRSQFIVYNVVVQVVLLYGSEIWVVKYLIMTVLGVFHKNISRLIAGMRLLRGDIGEC